MSQERLFGLAPDSMAVSANLDENGWWTVVISHRTNGSHWSDNNRATYCALTTSELFDTICDDVARRLGL